MGHTVQCKNKIEKARKKIIAILRYEIVITLCLNIWQWLWKYFVFYYILISIEKGETYKFIIFPNWINLKNVEETFNILSKMSKIIMQYFDFFLITFVYCIKYVNLLCLWFCDYVEMNVKKVHSL